MESLGERLAAGLDVSWCADVLVAMRAAPWHEVVAAWEEAQREGGVGRGLPNQGTINHLSVDGYILPAAPGRIWAAAAQARVPFMTGTVSAEGFSYLRTNAVDSLAAYQRLIERRFGERADAAARYYPARDDENAVQAAQDVFGDDFVRGVRTAARWQAAIEPSTYLYQFQYVAPADAARGLPPMHTAEIRYLFGRLPEDEGYTDEDRRVSASLMGYWTRFARAGDPNGDGAPTWPTFSKEGDAYLAIGRTAEARTGLRREALDFLESLRRR
jgi:para-nitrobenzyl esterase